MHVLSEVDSSRLETEETLIKQEKELKDKAFLPNVC